MSSIVSVIELWSRTCTGAGVSAVVAEQWWDVLLKRYTEPQRYYHTMTHLAELATHYGMLLSAGALHDPAAVAWTLFFHDIIYFPERRDNEEASAETWSEFADEAAKGGASIDQQLVTTVRRYILATKSHMSVPADADTDLVFFIDMDIAILGASRERYDEYANQIRAEYIHYPQIAYVRGRAEVLRSFLAHQPLFRTAAFRESHEAQAGTNLAWELTQLDCPPLKVETLYFADRAEILQFESDHGRTDSARLHEDAMRHLLTMNTGAFAMGLRVKDTNELVAVLLASAATSNSQAEQLLERVSGPTPDAFGDVAVRLGSSDPYSTQSATDTEITGDHVFIHSITVARSVRRKGVASKLLAEYMDFVASQGQIRWVTAVVPENLVRLFEREEFHGVRPFKFGSGSPAGPSPSLAAADVDFSPVASPSSGKRGAVGPWTMNHATKLTEMVRVIKRAPTSMAGSA